MNLTEVRAQIKMAKFISFRLRIGDQTFLIESNKARAMRVFRGHDIDVSIPVVMTPQLWLIIG